MIIKPEGKRLLVKVEEPKKMIGTIKIPQANEQDHPRYADVISVGDGVKTISEGARIIISKRGGVEIPQEDEKLHIVDLEDVVAVVN